MLDKKLVEQIAEGIEYEQPIILLMKTSVPTAKRMEVVKLIMKSSLPTRVSNFKKSNKIDKAFIDDMTELNRQLNEGIIDQWILVFKDSDTMTEAFTQLGMEDIPDECTILTVE